MAKAHNAQGTVKELAEIIGNICDGALMEPVNVEQASAALATKTAAKRARSHYDLAAAAVRGSYWLAKYGDKNSADAINNLMMGVR
jgi:hypothetical protein